MEDSTLLMPGEYIQNTQTIPVMSTITYDEFVAAIAPLAPILPSAVSASGQPFVLHPPHGQPVTVYVPAWLPVDVLAHLRDYAAVQWVGCPVTVVRVAFEGSANGAAMLGLVKALTAWKQRDAL